MSGRYILEGHDPVRCDSLMRWAEYFECSDRRVKQETVNGLIVSTVFFGLDHSFGFGPPLLFETMVFSISREESAELEMDRYSTWEQAEAGHAAMVERVRRGEIRREDKDDA